MSASSGGATRTARRLAAVLVLSTALLAIPCAPALAHAQLLSTEPAADAKLAESPDQVQLRFSEPVEAEFSPVEVYDSGGDRVDEDNARVDPDDARVVLVDLEELPEGSYTVEWRVTSIDGHVVDGTYGFAVGEAAGPADAGTRLPAGAEPAAREGATGIGGAHGGHYAALGFVVLVMIVAVVLRRR